MSEMTAAEKTWGSSAALRAPARPEVGSSGAGRLRPDELTGRRRRPSGALVGIYRWVRRTPAVMAVVVGLVALAARLTSISGAYDTFIDEITYTQVAVNIAHGSGLTLYGSKFDLQPPAVLGLLAAIIHLRHEQGSLEQILLSLRPVSAVFGALACAGTYLLVRRAVAERFALAAGALMAINPLVLSYDGLVMLEPFAQAAAVACVGLLAAAISARRRPAAVAYALLAGLFGGIVVTSKETFGLVLVATILLFLITGWVAHRREIAVTLIGTVTCYGVYLVVLAGTTGLGAWWTAKTTGLKRILGTYQPTGFNAPSTHVSFLSRATADAAQFGTSYVLLVTGGLAAAGLFVWGRPWRPGWQQTATPSQRVTVLIAGWGVVAGAYLAFETLFGSIEEQMFYIMVLPTTAALVILASRIRRRSWRPVLAAALVVVLSFDLGAWATTRTADHNADQAFLQWAGRHLPADSVISCVEGGVQFLVQNQRVGVWTTVPELRANHVEYVLLDTSLVAQGYAPVSLAFEKQLDRLAPVVWSAPETGGGSLRLYDVKALDRA
jgi:hypothetical protein